MQEVSNQEKEILAKFAKIELSHRSFWDCCQTIAPGFYKDDRPHLRELCDTLQALYEGRIIKFKPEDEWQIVDKIVAPLQDHIVCKRLMMNLPPQYGKSRTLIYFCMWVFGKNTEEKIITCSYNDSTASDFSRYTRDGIAEEKNDPAAIVYSDIFPDTRIKDGNASFEKWALDGQHFSYIGAGVGGSITSKGGTILIVDDPVKDAETAYNANALEKIWKWYTGTFLSRVSAPGGEPIEIVNMTRWSKNDICGKILEMPGENLWYKLKMEAYNEATDEMLCPELLSKNRYNYLKDTMDEAIFYANYHQQPVDIQDRLYQSFKTYTEPPKDDNGNVLFTEIRNYTDTADEGNDYLCSICYGVYMGEAYIIDVYYTKEGMEVTEPATAKMLVDNKVNTADVESNNGGRGFARNVDRLQWELYKTRRTIVRWFHQSKNKIARILSNSTFVMYHIYFPVNWKDRWPLFYKDVTQYQKEGKNKNDDAPDCLTGIAETITKRSMPGVVKVKL